MDYKKLKKPLTRHGFDQLAKEHDELRNNERPKVVKGVQIAAAEGDRSENAEYIYGKKRLREIDKRLGYLHGLLTDVQIVDPEIIAATTITFGATVTIQDENGKDNTYTIVGEGETEFTPGSISWKSPMAKALLGKSVGDFAFVERPAGDMEFEVLAIRYSDNKC